VDNISLPVQGSDIVAVEHQSYVTYMTPLPMYLNDLEGHFRCLKPFCLTYVEKYIVHYLRYVYTWIEMRTWLVISTTFL